MSEKDGRMMVFWINRMSGEQLVVFDPWHGGFSMSHHNNFHTRWAKNVHDHIVGGEEMKPAKFDWSGETVYIVCGGDSLGRSIDKLNERNGRAIFVNASALQCDVKDGDYMIAIDQEIAETDFSDIFEEIGLIAFPGLKKSFTDQPWADKRWFIFRNQCPLNDWMREAFYGIAELSECITTTVAAVHLAVDSGAKRIVIVGSDFCVKTKPKDMLVEMKNVYGKTIYLGDHYAKASQAVTYFCKFIEDNGIDCEVVNTALGGTLGINIFAEDKERICPWIKRMTIDEAVKQDQEDHHG